jgi:N-acetylglutamate synthase-like GNAT family acetyltransferase
MVSLRSWLGTLFAPSSRLRVPPRHKALPACSIRELRDTDIVACQTIYRLNESEHFPPGHGGAFDNWLVNRRASILVIESQKRLVAVGGINITRHRFVDLGILTFGMVHPDYQRSGFGTVLLLARLLLLPDTSVPRMLLITTVRAASSAFYSRFGFTYTGTSSDQLGNQASHFYASYTKQTKLLCAESLQESSISAGLLGQGIVSVNRLMTLTR